MDWPLDQSSHLEATILPTKIASKMSIFYPASTHSRPFMLAQSYLPFWDSKLSTFLINVLLGKQCTIIIKMIMICSKLLLQTTFFPQCLTSSQTNLLYIIARLFRGMHWNCQSQGSHFFIPRGEGMKEMTPEGLVISMHPEKWSCNSIST